MTTPGVPRLLLQSNPLPAWITDDADWIDLERIRHHALSMGWFPRALNELDQVFALEATVATERGWSHPALQDGDGPFVVGVWDNESSPTPIVLYKHCEVWTAEDVARIIAHIRGQAEEQQAEVRALRAARPDHPGNGNGEVRPASGLAASWKISPDARPSMASHRARHLHHFTEVCHVNEATVAQASSLGRRRGRLRHHDHRIFMARLDHG